MKWMNKGHEIGKKDISFSNGFHKKIYVFGAGQIGEVIGLSLAALGLLGGYIDNNRRLQGTEFLNKPIISLEDYLSSEDDPAIVVACAKKHELEIEQQLKQNQLVWGKDYFFSEEFHKRILPIIATLYFDKVYMQLAQITLTERCSLKCKKCAHACYNVDSSNQDLTLDQVHKSADSFFAKVDFINEFVLIGGEPLLYKDLSNVIAYIGERYRSQMAIFCITTNGTIVPNEEVLQACQKYKVLFRISNYAKAIPRLKESHQKLIQVLEKYDIGYRLSAEDASWIDYGFEYLNKELDEEKLTETFDKCLTPCREIRENRLYFCVMARSVSDNLHFDEGKDDYLDLDQLNGENYKRELMEFNLGYSEKGYLDMCHRCHGMDAVNYPIPVAEQLT